MERLKHRWLGVMLAAAMALNMLLPFFATYSDTAPPSGLASVFGEKVLICTGQGFAVVNWEDLLAGKAPVERHKSYSCPACYIANSVMGKVLLLLVFVWCFVRTGTTGYSLFSRYGARLTSLIHAASRPRAPPFSFSY